MRSQRLSSCHSLNDFLPRLPRAPFLTDSDADVDIDELLPPLLSDVKSSSGNPAYSTPDGVDPSAPSLRRSLTPSAPRSASAFAFSSWLLLDAEDGDPGVNVDEDDDDDDDVSTLIGVCRFPARKSAADTTDGLRDMDVSNAGEEKARRRLRAPAYRQREGGRGTATVNELWLRAVGRRTHVVACSACCRPVSPNTMALDVQPSGIFVQLPSASATETTWSLPPRTPPTPTAVLPWPSRHRL